MLMTYTSGDLTITHKNRLFISFNAHARASQAPCISCGLSRVRKLHITAGQGMVHGERRQGLLAKHVLPGLTQVGP